MTTTTADPPLTRKLEGFLASSAMPTPFVVIDVDHVEQRYHDLRTALPAARVYYAVKANPGRRSWNGCVALGRRSTSPARPRSTRAWRSVSAPIGISYGNTIKKRRRHRVRRRVGVRRFTVDCARNSTRSPTMAPGASCLRAALPRLRRRRLAAVAQVRLRPPATSSDCSSPPASAGLECGVSFHVGSQQRDLDDVGRHARRRRGGVRPRSRPRRDADVPQPRRRLPRAPIASTCRRSPGTAAPSATRSDTGSPTVCAEVMIEPGRYLVADAGVLRTRGRAGVARASTATSSAGCTSTAASSTGSPRRWTKRSGTGCAPVARRRPDRPGGDRRTDVRLGRRAVREERLRAAADTLARRRHRRHPRRPAPTPRPTARVGFNGFPPLAEHFV